MYKLWSMYFLFLLFLRFVDFVSLDSDAAGIEYIDASSQNSPWGGATIQNSLMVGHSELRTINSYETKIGSNTNCTTNGILLPFSSRLTVSDTTFVNFDEDGCRTFGTCAHCKPFDGAAIVRTTGLTFTDSPNKISFPFTHATVIEDLDGSISGHTGASILPTSGYLDPADCEQKPEYSFGVKGSVCRTTKFAAISWNEMKPESIDGKDAYLTNQHGSDIAHWRKKSKTGHPEGYTTFLPINQEVTLSFQNSSQFTNISYSMSVIEMPPDQFAYIKTDFKQIPDHFKTVDIEQNNTLT